jgi:DNA-binding NarL/FixJ family response regulator
MIFTEGNMLNPTDLCLKKALHWKVLIISIYPPPTTYMPNVAVNQFICLDKLTNQELKILKLMVLYLSNKQIAEKLHVCEGTIKKHRKNIYAKLSICGKEQVRLFLRKIENILYQKENQ